MEELPSIQPWQGFTAMFVTFWAVSAYFDHFLMTTVFCIAFGVISEIFVKTAYGGDNETPTELETQKKQLESLVSLATEQEQDLTASASKKLRGEAKVEHRRDLLQRLVFYDPVLGAATRAQSAGD